LKEALMTRSSGTTEANLAILKTNPELSTVWNIRREIILQSISDEILVNDLEILNSVMLDMQFTKAYCLWTHRRWLMNSLKSRGGTLEKIIINETLIVAKILDLDGRNFHAWSYRQFLADEFNSFNDPDEDLKFSDVLIARDFSNYSAYFLRINAIERGASVSPTDELEMVWNAIFTEPNDQSVWQYHDWLLTRFGDEIAEKDREYMEELETILEKKDKKYLLLAKLRQGETEHIQTLIEIDPFRKQFYLDQKV
jgi:geranylgeranyl transferase type-2 subunit alpha